MPPNFQRFLPFILIGIVVLFVVPALFKKHNSGPSSSTKSTETIDAVNQIDKSEVAYKTAHGRFTSNIADLVSNPKLTADLAINLAVDLDVSTDGQTYFARVSSDVISLARARKGDKVIAQSCVVVKSGSGVTCPATKTAKK